MPISDSAAAVAWDEPLPSPGIGHNGGPELEATSWHRWCWRRSYEKAWKTPPREIVLRRMRRAKALGMTYREYTLEIMERGRYL